LKIVFTESHQCFSFCQPVVSLYISFAYFNKKEVEFTNLTFPINATVRIWYKNKCIYFSDDIEKDPHITIDNFDYITAVFVEGIGVGVFIFKNKKSIRPLTKKIAETIMNDTILCMLVTGKPLHADSEKLLKIFKVYCR